MSADKTDGVVLIGDNVPEGYELVELKMVPNYSWGCSWHKDGRVFRHSVDYHNDGRIDGRRSRFYIDGKRVSEKVYKAEGGFW